jgi:glutaredoxin
MEEQNKENISKKDKLKQSLKKIPTHNWALATYILGIVAILLVTSSFNAGFTGSAISESTMRDNVESYLVSQLGSLDDVEIESVKKENGLYVANINFQGDSMPLYFTLDGKFISQGRELMELDTEPTQNNQNTQPDSSSYSSEDLEELRKFNECLGENGIVIYGSETCPHCRNLVNLLGGYEIANPVYVECTEQRERCTAELKTKYVPEIQLNGDLYEGGRNIEDLAQVTGCPVPNLS